MLSHRKVAAISLWKPTTIILPVEIRIVKKSVVEVALELVQEDRAYHCCSMMQKKPIVDISNKKGMDSGKLSKDHVFLKACRTYYATLES